MADRLPRSKTPPLIDETAMEELDELLPSKGSDKGTRITPSSARNLDPNHKARDDGPSRERKPPPAMSAEKPSRTPSPPPRGAAAEPHKKRPHKPHKDPICRIIGNYGLWQLRMTFMLALVSFPCTFHIFATTYTTNQAADFWCARPHNIDVANITAWRKFSRQDASKCSMVQYDWSKVTVEQVNTNKPPLPENLPMKACDDWEFDHSEVGETIVSEWNMVCDREWRVEAAEVLFLLGVGIGGVISGLISDRLGRRTTLLTALSVQTVVAFFVAFCPWFEVYLLMRIVLGTFSVSVVFAGFVLSMELVGGKWRAVAGVCNFMPLPVSYILVSLLSWVLPDWRTFQITISVPGLFLMSYWWLIPESPRWLLSMNRVPEVKQILIKAATVNRRRIPASIDKILAVPTAMVNSEVKPPGVKGLLSSSHRKITICLFIIWFSMTMVYYGLVLNMGKVGGELHFTSILGGLVEIPALLLSIPILILLGRIFPITTMMFVSGAGCFGAACCEQYNAPEWVLILCVMISKFAISGVNGVLPIFTAEQYPTLMRNLGVGASQVAAGLALVCMPIMWAHLTMQESMSVTGIFGVLGGFCVLLLPDTSNKTLQEDDEESSRPPTPNTPERKAIQAAQEAEQQKA